MQRREITLADGHWWGYCPAGDEFHVMRPDGSKTGWHFWCGILVAVRNGERSLWFDSVREARSWARENGCSPFAEPAARAA